MSAGCKFPGFQGGYDSSTRLRAAKDGQHSTPAEEGYDGPQRESAAAVVTRPVHTGQSSISRESRDAMKCDRKKNSCAETRNFATFERKERKCVKAVRAAGGPEKPVRCVDSEVTVTDSHDLKVPTAPETNVGVSSPNVEIMHLTAVSSSYIGNFTDVDQREIYVNTVDSDGNPLDVEKLASPKIPLTFQKFSYRTGISEDLLTLIDTGSVINLMSYESAKRMK
jgi:hypothetical protein